MLLLCGVRECRCLYPDTNRGRDAMGMHTVGNHKEKSAATILITDAICVVCRGEFTNKKRAR